MSDKPNLLTKRTEQIYAPNLVESKSIILEIENQEVNYIDPLKDFSQCIAEKYPRSSPSDSNFETATNLARTAVLPFTQSRSQGKNILINPKYVFVDTFTICSSCR